MFVMHRSVTCLNTAAMMKARGIALEIKKQWEAKDPTIKVRVMQSAVSGPAMRLHYFFEGPSLDKAIQVHGELLRTTEFNALLEAMVELSDPTQTTDETWIDVTQ